MATEGDTTQAAVAQGSQKTADRVEQEQVIFAGSSSGVQVARPVGNTRKDRSRLLSLGELLESGKLESSCTAPVTIRVSARQSGVPGVSWQSKGRSWRVRFGRMQRETYFPVREYFKFGMSEEEASKAALEAAILCRRSQEASGTAKVGQGAGGCPGGKPVVTRGFFWDKQTGSWRVQIKVKGKKICGGRFKPKDGSPEEVNFARRLAVARRRSLEKQYCRLDVLASEDSEIQKMFDKTKDSEVGKKHELTGAVKKREIEMLRHQLESIKTKAQDSTLGIISRKTTPRRKRSKHASLR